ncbi:hypothetical protein [Sphingomonas sp.]|uniref:hypothetical protein n=1 Tax=Sphingomonas sp. TaxID=28214 RepID=UPI003D6CA47A
MYFSSMSACRDAQTTVRSAPPQRPFFLLEAFCGNLATLFHRSITTCLAQLAEDRNGNRCQIKAAIDLRSGAVVIDRATGNGFLSPQISDDHGNDAFDCRAGHG